MSLGDIKPASLLEVESLIWKDLYLVARCRLSPDDMVQHVLDHIIDTNSLESLGRDKHRLRQYFKDKYDPIRDHMDFFQPCEFCYHLSFCIGANALL